MFKPWAIAQAFCSKTAKFRPLRIHPKSTHTVSQRLRNNFRTVSQAFQRVWGDSQNLPKSAMFKPWAITQGFCSKTAKFRPSRIHPKSTQTVAQRLRNYLEWFRRYFREFGAISRTYQNRPFSKPWAIAQGFAQKRPNFDPCEFTRNRHRQSRNDLEIILEWFRRYFREFGAIFRTYQKRPCSNHGL